MADISASNWSETDANNTTAAPDGAPEGMAPSGVNDVLRAHQGAVKRFWNKINAVKTTAGTTSAYTLTYDVAPAAYVDGEIISFVVNAANAASATINVNALGAKSLRLFGAALMPGALAASQIVTARYNSAAGAFDIIPQNGWVRLSSVDASASSAVDFTSIPAGVNHLMLLGEATVSVSGVSMYLRTYGADGVIDSAGSDYSYNIVEANAGAVGQGTTTTSFIALAGNVAPGSTGIGLTAHFQNIQNTTYTKLNWSANAQGTISYVNTTGTGFRAEADRITGVRVYPSSGNLTGKFTLFGSA